MSKPNAPITVTFSPELIALVKAEGRSLPSVAYFAAKVTTKTDTAGNKYPVVTPGGGQMGVLSLDGSLRLGMWAKMSADVADPKPAANGAVLGITQG